MTTEKFPIDLGKLVPLKLNPAVTSLTDAQRDALRQNIQLARDAIVFFTSLAGARGLSGHTGGAYDTVPEVMIIRAFIANGAFVWGGPVLSLRWSCSVAPFSSCSPCISRNSCYGRAPFSAWA